MGQLVTHSRFSTAHTYSYLVCSTSPDGSLPFFKENHGSCSCEDLDAGWDAHGTCIQVLAASGPIRLRPSL
jgi:hypothetical protein